MQIDWDKLVVAKDISGAQYIGDIVSETNFTVVMRNVRQLETATNPQIDQRTGAVMGFSKSMALMPVDMFDGPMPELTISVASLYFPGKNKEAKRQVQNLVDTAERNEVMARTSLVLPGGAQS